MGESWLDYKFPGNQRVIKKLKLLKWSNLDDSFQAGVLFLFDSWNVLLYCSSLNFCFIDVICKLEYLGLNENFHGFESYTKNNEKIDLRGTINFLALVF
jgi:hypothetical protein